MHLLPEISAMQAVAVLAWAGAVAAQAGQVPLDPGTAAQVVAPTITQLPLRPAESCPANVKCGPDIHTDTVTRYNDTTYVTRPAYATTNHTILLTSTSLVVNVSTVTVTPVAMCETKTVIDVPTNLTVFVDQTTTLTQELFATTTVTSTTVAEYKSTLSLACLQDMPSVAPVPPVVNPPVVNPPIINPPVVNPPPVVVTPPSSDEDDEGGD